MYELVIHELDYCIMVSPFRYRRWPKPEQIARDYHCSLDEARLTLLNLKVLIPDDEKAQLIYLNEFLYMVDHRMHPAQVMIRLMNIIRNRYEPYGIIWQREKEK